MKKILIIALLSSSVLSGADGTLDLTFGPNGTGFVSIDNNAAADLSLGMAIQSDGKIVASGASGSNLFVVRRTPDGFLDASFNPGGLLPPSTAGQVLVDIEDSAVENIREVVIQPDGKIVAVGDCNQSTMTARFQLSGALDPTFNSAGNPPGTRCELLSAGNDQAFSVLIQPDGKILVGGKGNSHDVALVRYNTDGTLDTTFNGTGFVIDDLGGTFEQFDDIALLDDGRIVGIGQSVSGPANFLIARYTASGQRDTTFGTGGVTTTNITGGNDRGRRMLVQSDGTIVVCGVAGSNFGLVRYTADGVLDTTFGTAGTGIVTTNLGGGGDIADAMVQQSDGKIVVAGRSNAGPGTDYALARYSVDGVLDLTFGPNGTGFVISNEIPGSVNLIRDMKLASDGKIVVTGYSNASGNNDFVVARYTNDSLSGTTSELAQVTSSKYGNINLKA